MVAGIVEFEVVALAIDPQFKVRRFKVRRGAPTQGDDLRKERPKSVLEPSPIDGRRAI